MEFDRLTKLLIENFPTQLPGKVAHLGMAPKPIDENRFLSQINLEARKSGVLILIYPERGKATFPLIKRPSYFGVHSAQVALPGGKMEPDDPDIIFTALREAEEEVGVDASKIQVIGQLSQLYIPASRFLVFPVIGIVEQKPNWVPDPKEVSRILPTSVEELMREELRKETQIPIPSMGEITAPFFDLHQEIVWGATAMILNELIAVLRANQ